MAAICMLVMYALFETACLHYSVFCGRLFFYVALLIVCSIFSCFYVGLTENGYLYSSSCPYVFIYLLVDLLLHSDCIDKKL